MLPILFHWGPFTLYTLGLFLGIGFFLASFIFWRRLRELGFAEEKTIDFVLLTGVVSIIFARVLFIVENLSNFPFALANYALYLRYPGLSFWGGVSGCLVVLWWFTKRQKWNFWKVGDELVFSLLPFFILAQLGCFFDGSPLGKVTGMPWGMYFPGSFLRRQPVPLFYAILLLLSWLILLRLERHWRFWNWYKSKASGLLFLLFCAALFFSNLILAFLRETRLYFYWLEVSLSISALIASVIIIYFRSGRKITEDLVFLRRRKKT